MVRAYIEYSDLTKGLWIKRENVIVCGIALGLAVLGWAVSRKWGRKDWQKGGGSHCGSGMSRAAVRIHGTADR